MPHETGLIATIALIHEFPINPLPKPSGEYAVGVRTFEVADASRRGVFAAKPDEPRRLLVKVCADEAGSLLQVRLGDANGAPDPSIELSTDAKALVSLALGTALAAGGCGAFAHSAACDAPGFLASVQAQLREAAQELTTAPASAFRTDEMQFRRILRSLQVEGTAAAAATLTDLAAASTFSPAQRLLALRTLQNFVNPPPIDPTNGLWRPLPPRDAAMVRTAVAATLGKVLDEAPGEVKAPALTLSVSLGLPVALEKLTAWAADASQPAVLRLSALAQLPPAQALGFATHDLPELRAAAARQAAAAFPDKAAGLAADLIQRASATDLLAAAAIYVITTAAGPVGWLGYVQAFAEAAMVGALAAP